MSNLFQLPFVTILPGDKLYFRATGTSTPQNTYADPDLTTPNSNPMSADAAGNLAPIYLDSSLPDYRVIRTTSADVTYPGYPVDNVPASSDQAQAYRVKGIAPEIIFEETDQGTDAKKWRIQAQSGVLTIAYGNDAENTWVPVLPALTRTAASGSFTATLTGMASATTGTIVYQRVGNLVYLRNATGVRITGTSNANTLTMTGLPASIQPAAATGVRAMDTWISDHGRGAYAGAYVGGGTVVFGLGAAVSDGYPDQNGFTTSGTKGLPVGWFMTYSLD